MDHAAVIAVMNQADVEIGADGMLVLRLEAEDFAGMAQRITLHWSASGGQRMVDVCVAGGCSRLCCC